MFVVLFLIERDFLSVNLHGNEKNFKSINELFHYCDAIK